MGTNNEQAGSENGVPIWKEAGRTFVSPMAKMALMFVIFVACFLTGSGATAAMLFLVMIAAALAMAGDQKKFSLNMMAASVGIVLPTVVFLVSGLAGPSWKGECQYGWVDCFQSAKMALLPLVVWAVAAFQVAQVVRPAAKPEPWVVSGLILGTVISAVCLVYYRLVLPDTGNAGWLLVPLVTLTWYGGLMCRALVDFGFSLREHLKALVISSPLGIASVIWSKDTYAALPNIPPSQCFVVTAASKGHEGLVGPFAVVARRGEPRRVNQQLLTFWKLEALWQERAPVTHRRIRRVYNRVGPWLAQRINHRVKADLVYLALKPFEWLARGVVLQSAAGFQPAGNGRTWELACSDERRAIVIPSGEGVGVGGCWASAGTSGLPAGIRQHGALGFVAINRDFF